MNYNMITIIIIMRLPLLYVYDEYHLGNYYINAKILIFTR